MKTIRFFGMVLMTMLLSVGFAACGDDDDDNNNSSTSSLSGTTWKITAAAENEIVGATMTFKADGNAILNPSVGWTYCKWSVSDGKLKIVCGEGEPDDYMLGTYIISGNAATYNYSWYDYDGKWGGEGSYSMTLQKQ